MSPTEETGCVVRCGRGRERAFEDSECKLNYKVPVIDNQTQ